MAGSMSMGDLVTDLKNSLKDAAGIFSAENDGDFKRHLQVAAADFNRVLPLVKMGELSLVADQALYAAPPDLVTYNGDAWSVGKMPKPWEDNYPGLVPTVRLIGPAGSSQLAFSPAPTIRHIGVFGSAFKYYYRAPHLVAEDAAQTTIQLARRPLLILRAQAEAMRELSMRNANKPVQLRDGLTQAPRNSTPSALFQALLNEFERSAGCAG